MIFLAVKHLILLKEYSVCDSKAFKLVGQRKNLPVSSINDQNSATEKLACHLDEFQRVSVDWVLFCLDSARNQDFS